MPVPHWNWPGLHLNSATGRIRGALLTSIIKTSAYNSNVSRLLRSDHSRQSAGSSEWSPQSSSVSHFHQNGMHLSFLQTNWRKRRKTDDFFKISGIVMCHRVLIQADMLLPDWRCSWTSSVCHRLLGKSWWGKRTCNRLQERASTGYCSLHCLSGTGGLPLKRRDMLTRRTQSKSDRTRAQMKINMWLLMTGIFVLPSGWRYGW